MTLRHINGKTRTTIRLEPAFWLVIERQAAQAGITWHEWVIRVLEGKPDGSSLASWLRVSCINQFSHQG